MTCIRHDFHTVNNPRFLPATDIDLGTQKREWVTETRCRKCGEKLENPYKDLVRK